MKKSQRKMQNEKLFSHHVSRITHPVSRITHHVSRITHHVSRITKKSSIFVINRFVILQFSAVMKK